MSDIVAMFLVGLGAGVLGGLFGIGGGLVIVPALVLLRGLDLKTAVGTSLFALLWPVGILGVREYWLRDQMRLSYGAWIAIGLVLGILVGARVTAPLSRETMQRLYGGFLVAVGIYYIFGLQPKQPTRPAPVVAPESPTAP